VLINTVVRNERWEEKDMMDKGAWELELWGYISLNEYLTLRRVPGGWLLSEYSLLDSGYRSESLSITMLPYISYEKHMWDVEQSRDQLACADELIPGTKEALEKISIK